MVGPRVRGQGVGGPLDGTPQQRGQQRLSWTFSEEEDEEEKKKKPQMPKEFQWVEVPPPLREYLGKEKQEKLK